MMSIEHIEKEENQRYSTFPIHDKDMWEMYKTVEKTFWVDDEINAELAKDRVQFPNVDSKIQHFIKHIVSFFTVSDGIVNEILEECVSNRIKIREAKIWYDFQRMIENVHNTTYSKLMDTYFTSIDERNRALRAHETIPTIKRKVEWIHKWVGIENDLHRLDSSTLESIKEVLSTYEKMKDVMGGNLPANIVELKQKIIDPKPNLATILLINILIEGLFFSGSFCAIFWIYHQYQLLPGLTKANEFISRDEGSHASWGIMLYRYKLLYQLPENKVHQIVREAVDIEKDFICEALPNDLLGMNSRLMTQYIKYTADQLLHYLGYSMLFNVENPFPWMSKQSIAVRIGDFFKDGNISEYTHHASGQNATQQTLAFDEDDI